MADKQPETPPKKVVPDRNDFETSALYKGSRALQLQNRDPDFVYQAFSTDPESPAYIGNRLTAHERGNPSSGYVMVKPWQVVHSQTDADVRSLDPREDQGKGVDTVMRYGRQIMCRLPRSEFGKYAMADEAYQTQREKEIYSPDRRDGRTTALTTINSRDEDANHMEMLRRAGHPMPGVGG